MLGTFLCEALLKAQISFSATQENVRRIGRDLASSLYSEFHINFIGDCSEKLLEDLALSAVESNKVGLVCGLKSRQLDFVALEEDLFHLNIDSSYALFNDEAIDGDFLSIIFFLLLTKSAKRPRRALLLRKWLLGSTALLLPFSAFLS